MKFLADMGISPETVRFLNQMGHSAVHLSTEGLERLSDHAILDKARREAAVVLTHDLDFGDLLAASGEALPSVVLFRLADMRPANVNRHLQNILTQQVEVLTAGAILSVNERAVRVRRLPIT